MKFVLGVIVAMAFLIAVNLGMIALDIDAGNVLNFTKDTAILNIGGSNSGTQFSVELFDVVVSDDTSMDEAAAMKAAEEEAAAMKAAEEEAAAMKAAEEEAAAMKAAEEEAAAMKAAEEEAAAMKAAEEEGFIPVPMSVDVELAIGSGVPGCEDKNECFLPPEVSIGIGGTVNWINDDAGHTVTAGDIQLDPAAVGVDFPNGFDSGFFLAGNTFSNTFDVAGEYPYYCQVHPWMQGIVSVQ